MAQGYCTHCGFVGWPVKFMPGSLLLEVMLWLFLIVPGVIYTGVRRTKAYYGCPRCMAPNMIPLDSPFAQSAASVVARAQITHVPIFCTACGRQLFEGTRFCDRCGAL